MKVAFLILFAVAVILFIARITKKQSVTPNSSGGSPNNSSEKLTPKDGNPPSNN